MTKSNEELSKEYREKGTECLKNKKYLEAVLNYTFAIKFDLRNAELYSNRSMAFLKSEQCYYSLEDAEQAIAIRPRWAKGYLCKADALFAGQRYEDALEAYQKVLQLQPDNTSVNDFIVRTKAEIIKLRRQEQQLPWLGSAIGLLFGIVCVLFEYIIMKNALFKHPLLQVLLIITVAFAGFCIAKLIRKYMKSYRNSLLDKPLDLFGDEEEDVKSSGTKGPNKKKD